MCYTEIYTPTDQTEISKNYRLAHAEPFDFKISEDGLKTLWTKAKGRFELKAGDEWGTVCSHNANAEAANIMCKSVGLPFEKAEVVPNYPKGAEESVKIWFDDVKCKGTENEFKYCQISTYIKLFDDVCDHNQDLGVVCQ